MASRHAGLVERQGDRSVPDAGLPGRNGVGKTTTPLTYLVIAARLYPRVVL